MRVIKARKMGVEAFIPLTLGSIRIGGKLGSAAFFVSSVLAVVFLLASSFGCGPPSQNERGQNQPPSESGEMPEITDELIHERINDTYIRDVPPMEGTGEPISWSFDHDEPKEIVVLEKKMDGTHATIVLDVKTGSSPRARNQRQLAGQIRTEWELRTGWVLRRWEIERTENISMKYKNLPKPPEQNSDH